MEEGELEDGEVHDDRAPELEESGEASGCEGQAAEAVSAGVSPGIEPANAHPLERNVSATPNMVSSYHRRGDHGRSRPKPGDGPHVAQATKLDPEAEELVSVLKELTRGNSFQDVMRSLDLVSKDLKQAVKKLDKLFRRVRKRKGDSIEHYPECFQFSKRILEGLHNINKFSQTSAYQPNEADAARALFKAAMNYRHDIFNATLKAEVEQLVRTSKAFKCVLDKGPPPTSAPVSQGHAPAATKSTSGTDAKGTLAVTDTASRPPGPPPQPLGDAAAASPSVEPPEPPLTGVKPEPKAEGLEAAEPGPVVHPVKQEPQSAPLPGPAPPPPGKAAMPSSRTPSSAYRMRIVVASTPGDLKAAASSRTVQGEGDGGAAQQQQVQGPKHGGAGAQPAEEEDDEPAAKRMRGAPEPAQEAGGAGGAGRAADARPGTASGAAEPAQGEGTGGERGGAHRREHRSSQSDKDKDKDRDKDKERERESRDRQRREGGSSSHRSQRHRDRDAPAAEAHGLEDPYAGGASGRFGASLDEPLPRSRLVLVLDLDGVLADSAPEAALDEAARGVLERRAAADASSLPLSRRELFRVEVGGVGSWVKLRPGARQLLARVAEQYELWAHTRQGRQYADAVVELLDPSQQLFGSRVIAQGVLAKRLLSALDGRRDVAVLLDTPDADWMVDRRGLMAVPPYPYFAPRDGLPGGAAASGMAAVSLLAADRDECSESGVLSNAAALLEGLHGRVMRAHASGGANDLAMPAAPGQRSEVDLLDPWDVRRALYEQRKSVLAGANITFSRVFPTSAAGEPMHPLWQLAASYGAVCSTSCTPDTTHVVTLSSLSDKAFWARDTGRHLVYPSWLECTCMLWRRVDELLFTVDD